MPNQKNVHRKPPVPGLVVFVKAMDPTQASSVVNRKDRSIRQKQEPTRYDTPKARTKIYLQPCLEHNPDTMVTVPAYIRYYAADLAKNIDMGIAQICFFCRSIVTEPSNGWYKPTETELEQLQTIYTKRSLTNREIAAERRVSKAIVVQPNKKTTTTQDQRVKKSAPKDKEWWEDAEELV